MTYNQLIKMTHSFTEDFMTEFGLDYESLDLSMLKTLPNYKQLEDYDDLFWRVSNEDVYVRIFSGTRKAVVNELKNMVNDFKETLKKLNKTEFKFTTQFDNADECKLLFYFLVANSFRNSINFGDIVNPYKIVSEFFDTYDFQHNCLGFTDVKSEFRESTSLRSLNYDYELFKQLTNDMLKEAKTLIDEVKVIDGIVSEINSCIIFPEGFKTEFIRVDYGFLA